MQPTNEIRTLRSKRGPLWLHINGQPYKVLNLPATVKVTTTVVPIPLTVFEYKQEFIDEALAWVSVADGDLDSKTISVRFVFKQDSTGLLRDVSVYATGVESVGLLVSGDKNAMDDYVQRILNNE